MHRLSSLTVNEPNSKQTAGDRSYLVCGYTPSPYIKYCVLYLVGRVGLLDSVLYMGVEWTNGTPVLEVRKEIPIVSYIWGCLIKDSVL